MQICSVDMPFDPSVLHSAKVRLGRLDELGRPTNMASHIHYGRAPSVDTQRGPFHHATASSADRLVQCSISRCTYLHPVSARSVRNWGRLGCLRVLSAALPFEPGENFVFPPQGGQKHVCGGLGSGKENKENIDKITTVNTSTIFE